MSFFNEPWADRVQIIAFPLELTGFVLTILEVYCRGISARLEQLLSWSVDKGGGTAQRTRSFLSRHRLIRSVVQIVVGGALITAVGLFVLLLTGIAAQQLRVTYGGWGPLFALFGGALALRFSLFGPEWSLRFVRWVNEKSGKRAIGVVGTFIAGLGILCEIYQFIYLWQDRGGWDGLLYHLGDWM